MPRTLRYAPRILLLLNGLLFISNIYVLGNPEAAIAMHNDLAPWASPLMANSKVLNCFVTGILYLVAFAAFILDKRHWALAGVVACLLFDGFYLVELALWGLSYSRVWFDFGVFGGLSLFFGAWSWRYWRSFPRSAPA
jgi:hypothetical protein